MNSRSESACASASASGPAFTPAVVQVLESGSIGQIQDLMRHRRLPVEDYVRWTLARIERIGGQAGINAVREVRIQALDDARQADARLAAGHAVDRLFGVPVLLKDNILTADGLRASAGAQALAGHVPSREATLVARLREAGAIVVGKANMTEWADYVSDVMPSGFSGVAGMVRNPHGGEPYGRGLGSSVGCAAAVAAGLVPLAIGTETQNSIQAPACHSSVVGVKPTVGLVSRAGVAPLVPSQDSPGPMARCVADAALALECMQGPDCRDTATLEAGPAAEPVVRTASPSALPAGLRGLRIGVPRRAVADRADCAAVMAPFEAVLARLSDAGAVIVDPCDLPGADDILQLRSSVFRCEFKDAMDTFLQDCGYPQGIRDMAGLVEWNHAHPQAIPFGQPLLIAARDSGGMASAGYRDDRLRDIALSRAGGIDAAMAAHDVDVLIAPMSAAAKITGKAGAPVVAIPAGLDRDGRPFGVTVFSSCGTDAHLIGIAGAVEAAAGQRIAPSCAWLGGANAGTRLNAHNRTEGMT